MTGIRAPSDQNRKTFVYNEKCYSNWFSLDLPAQLHFHHTSATPEQLELASKAIEVPLSRLLGQTIVTFAGAADVQEALGDVLKLKNSDSVILSEFIENGDEESEIAFFDARNIVSDLIRQAWDSELTRKDMRFHVLSKRNCAHGTSKMARFLATRLFSIRQVAGGGPTARWSDEKANGQRRD